MHMFSNSRALIKLRYALPLHKINSQRAAVIVIMTNNLPGVFPVAGNCIHGVEVIRIVGVNDIHRT